MRSVRDPVREFKRPQHTDTQLTRIIDLLSQRVNDLARPKGKKPALKAVTDLPEELKALKETLKPKIRGLVGNLNGLMMDDAEADWVQIIGNLIEVSCTIEVQ